ncbi:MAG: 3-oxoacyl-ACP reductase FabG [Nanoarchaeota archaeon]|nr:3-oxoacyl-ACP reductase FabG [Nanoarchaeota archaeon]MBU1644024.1 3-oxoacyl-ACP reductase FabG [Nanoarchaeota archaeon]MBU1976919.1 3-oxoacyl-ACP reductase FabG [Nanoarchaeota archaeon]
MKLKNKIIIITGSRRGIGFGIAQEMAKEGAKIVISDINQKECEKACKVLEKKYNVKTLAVKCDVSNKDEVDNLIQQTIKKFKKIDILVNNAGIVKFGSVLDKTEKEWDLTLNINLRSVFFCTKAVVPHMIKQKSGKIISLASIAGFVGFDNISDYCASKGGIIAITKELALELAKYNINVNAIAPGIIETKMTQAMLKDKKQRENLLAQTPLGRVGKPADIGKAAVFLASDDSDFITGHTLVVDGGWLAH